MTDEDVQDLKRENFNLKLRIYFLEEQTEFSVTANENQDQTSYIQQLQNEIERLRQRFQSQPAQVDDLQTTYNFDYDDERRAFREELDKYRQENELLRQTIQLNINKKHGEEYGKLITTTLPPTVGQSIQTTTSVDSGFDTTMPGMSSTFLSSSALHIELNECKERERKLQEQVNSLRQQLESSSSPQSHETLAELDRARRQLQQYEVDLKNYAQRQSKAERVLQRLQTDYEARIAHLVEEQQKQAADFETYRHEQDQKSPNVNIEEYRQAIIDRDRIIEQLEAAINEITIRLRTPFTLMLSSQSSGPEWTDERSIALIHELNSQMRTHLETVDQLRAECVELRRSEKILRNQIDSLTHLINTPVRNLGLPPLPRPSPPPSSSKNVDIIEDAQHVEDLQTAVVQITLQLQSDAENVSGLTNRVAQIIRDRDEWQDKINRLQDEIEKKNAHIRQLERREPEVEGRIRQQFALQIEVLHRDIKTLQEELKDRDRRLKEFHNEREEIRSQTRKDYEKIDTIHNQDKQSLQGQLRTANERLIELELQLADGRRQFDDLQRKYGKAISSTETQAEQLQREIQQQKIQIEQFNFQALEIENNFQKERRQLERERDLEKEKSVELQNVNNRRYNDLQTEYERLQAIFNEQQYQTEQQIFNYQTQVSQFNRERDNSNDEVQVLRRENQTFKDRCREIENKINELTRRNDEFKAQISVYEIRFQDNDAVDKRNRNEIAKLHRDIQDALRENGDCVNEANEWRRKYEIIVTDLNNSRYDKDQAELVNQTIVEENSKLKHDIDQLAIRIRLELQQEYENEYRQITAHKDSELQNIQKDKEAIRYDLEQLNSERTRLTDRLQVVENSLKHANETIGNYETDIDRLRQALNLSKETNEQLEREISHAYIDELNMKNDRIRDLENNHRSTETQLNEYEISLNDLRQANAKLIEYNETLQRQYEQYRFEQQNNLHTLQRNADDATKKNLTAFEERVRREVVQVTENKQELIDQLETQLREKDTLIQQLRDGRSVVTYQPKDLQLDLEIRVEQLEEEVETKERFIKIYSETVEEKDHQIEKLLDDHQQGDNNSSIVETLREELQSRDKRIEQILNEKHLAILDCEQHIKDLQIIIHDRERELVNINDTLQQAEHRFDIQHRELDDCRQKRDILTVDFNLAIDENEAHLDKIRILEKQIEMSQHRNSTTEQVAHLQNMLEDLKAKLRQRDDSMQRRKHRIDSLQSLQRTIADSERDLKETRLNHTSVQSDYNRAQTRYEQMEKQHKIDLENRDQAIASLRKKLDDKDQEINTLHDNDLAKEAKITHLRSKSRESDQDSKSEYSGARAPSNVSLRLELQKKDDLIEELQRRLERALRDKSPSGREDSSTSHHAQRIEVQRLPRSKTLDHLNREELLYELEMALQDNDGLVQQLAKKSPNITELHNQLLDVRKELARQKYINQVLWRKLDALLDIQGSNTRAELAHELANYHDELEALKARQHRANDTRVSILNASSRSSSELNISLLNNGISSSNIELQDKIDRLTEQLSRCENQSRYFYRELIKHQKLLYDAGLLQPSSVRQRGRSADDSNRKPSTIIDIITTNKKVVEFDRIENINELQQIVRNQYKYIQQLQIRVRIDTPDRNQSGIISEENKNLRLVIESCKHELKKLYKIIEFNRTRLQEYEHVIREQQNHIEQRNKNLNRCEKSFKKYGHHSSVLSEHKQNHINDIIIDLDIDIIQANDKKKKSSLNKKEKDSGVETLMDRTQITITHQEHQRQINERDEQIRHLTKQFTDRDEQIRQLTKQLNDLQKVHENEVNQYRLKSEKAHTDLIDDLNRKQDDLRQARLQIDLLKSTKTQLEQAQDQNIRLHGEIKVLQNEITNKKDLITHYDKQISLLEKQISSRDGGSGEMSIRTSEMSELLEEMRRLRHDLERSINKQNELQSKLEENIRQSRTPREFSFSGRGVSYPDLRLIDASGLIGAENLSFTSMTDEKRSRPLGASTTELETEHINLGKMYIVGDLENHENLRRLIADIKIELKAIEVKIKDKLRSKFTSSITEPSIEWLEHRLNSLNQCLTRLEQTYQLIESYWKAYLPVKNNYDEHPFNDQRLAHENKELKLSQSRYVQDLQSLRQKYKEQSVYMDQVLAQLTKANHKKANTDDYLALLLRPTLDVLQKARSNMEHHLKESSLNISLSPDSAQLNRRQRTNRLD